MSAEVLFGCLARLGPVTVAIHTPLAVLGWHGGYPRFGQGPLPVLPASSTHQFAPNLSEFASLWAVRGGSGEADSWHLEVGDNRGQVFHRIVVHTPESRALLEEAIVRHAGVGDRCPRPHHPNHALSRRRHAAVHGRIPFLMGQWALGNPRVRRLGVDCVGEVLSEAVLRAQSLRATLYHPALVGGAAWVPEFQQAGEGGSRRLFGGCVGLEVHPSEIRTVWLWRGICSCCQREKWAVEVGGPGEVLGLALMAPDEAGEATWRGFLQPWIEP